MSLYPILTSGNGAGGLGSTLIMIIPLIAFFYFLIIRPENKKKKQAEETRNAVKVGDRITTIGGIMGVVCSVKDDRIVIETSADQVRVELAKWSISTNDTAAEAAEAAAKKEAEARQKAKAAKKAEKANKK